MAEGLYTSFSVSGPVWVPAERGCKAAVVRSAAADEGSVVIGGGSGDGVCARAVQCVCGGGLLYNCSTGGPPPGFAYGQALGSHHINTAFVALGRACTRCARIMI